jgi:hypothetical protein
MPRRSSTSPSSQSERPRTEWPPAGTETGIPCSRANASAANRLLAAMCRLKASARPLPRGPGQSRVASRNQILDCLKFGGHCEPDASLRRTAGPRLDTSAMQRSSLTPPNTASPCRSHTPAADDEPQRRQAVLLIDESERDGTDSAPADAPLSPDSIAPHLGGESSRGGSRNSSGTPRPSRRR